VGSQSRPAETRIQDRRAGWRVLYVIALALMCWTCGTVAALGQSSSFTKVVRGRIAGVRSVSHGALLYTTRYSRIQDFDVYFSLRTGREKYCLDYETVVLDEIQDLTGSEGKDLNVSLEPRKNKVIIYTPERRKLKARMVRADLCEAPRVVRSVVH
jgi:hypothetical protein